MINVIKVRRSNDNDGTSIITFDLRDPASSGFLVSSPTGFEPVGADLKTAAYASGDGYVFNGAVSKTRNIILPIIFWEYNAAGSGGSRVSIEQLKLKLYDTFRVKELVDLAVYTDNRYGRISGYVDKIETDMFKQQSSAKISIICTDLWFKEFDPEDPDYFPSVKTRYAQLEYFYETAYTTGFFEYDGDVEVGFRLSLYPMKYSETDPIKYENGYLLSSSSGDRLELDTRRGEGIIQYPQSERLDICTEIRKQKLEIGQYGSSTPLRNASAFLVNRPDKWPMIKPGNNEIQLYPLIPNTYFAFYSPIYVYYETLYAGV